MLLSARWLLNVRSVNDFDYADKVEFSEGDPVTVYFQLIDASRDRDQGFKSSGRRYVPTAGATLQVTITNLDDAKAYVKSATQLYPTLDGSMWSITIATTDLVKGTPGIQLALTESAVTRRALLKGAVRVYPVSGA